VSQDGSTAMGPTQEATARVEWKLAHRGLPRRFEDLATVVDEISEKPVSTVSDSRTL